MRRTILTTTAGVTVIAAIAAIASTGTSLGAGSHPAKGVRRIHLVEREAQVTFLDRGKRGLSPGDQRLVSSNIFTPAGRLVGRGEFACTLTGAAGKTYAGTCNGGITLPGGQLTGEFVFTEATDRAPVVRQAITGGTGAYRGARGQFVAQQVVSGPTPVVVELEHD